MSSTSSTASYSIHKGTLQSSERVVWNTADNLGRGATAVVYLGRLKYIVKVQEPNRTQRHEILIRETQEKHTAIPTLERFGNLSRAGMAIHMQLLHKGDAAFLDSPEFPPLRRSLLARIFPLARSHSDHSAHEATSGHVVAVKLFHEHIRMVAGGEEVRELELLQRLKHENIITLFSIEKELTSKRVALVMEYCEGGSLYYMLDQPQYVYGLSEEEFLLVLKHVAAGIAHLRQHGIIHRDIKPGNIMRYITEEGRSVYKLTDFGAARELHEEENFTSLYGTEEYLHPGMYERAVLRLPTGQRFDAKVDLWSLGVTFYHVATGDLPFKPYGGRNNKEKMFEIISQKAYGVISGVQNFNQGPITWSNELPKTCSLSSGLKKQVIPLLAGLMEADDSRVISYEKFFHIVNSIGQKIHITVFHATSCCVLDLYLNERDNYSILKENIASLTEIPSSEQLLVLNGRHLESIIDPTAEIASYPLHVLQATIFLCQYDMKMQEKEKLVHPNIPQVSELDRIFDMDKDMRLAHSCAARAHLIKRYTGETVRKQELLAEAELCLRLYLQFRLKCTGERFLTMSQLLTEFKKRLQAFYTMLDMIRMLLSVLKYPLKSLDEIAKDKTLTAVHAKAEERTREIVTYRTALVERLDQDEDRMKKWCARCKDTDCLSKVSHHLSVITSIQSRFRRDKNVKDQMTQHDQHIHGCERQKLQDQCVAIASILQDHCYRNLDIMYSESMNFYGALSKNLNRISKIEKNIESVIDCQQLLSTKLGKIEMKCKEAYERAQTWVLENQNNINGPLQPTAPAESVGELNVAVTGQAKTRDTGLGTSYGVTQEAMQGAGPLPGKVDASLVSYASDISFELQSLMEESKNIVGMVEENNELIRKIEECALHSSGSLSRNLSQK